MASIVDVCNVALIELGQFTIADINAASEPARACKARFDGVRDAVQRMHPWNCCIVRGRWAADAVAPVFGFANQYTLPTDPYILRVLQVQDRNTRFKIEGRKVLVDDAGPVDVLAIRRQEDVAQWDALLVETVGLYLAHSIAFRLTANRGAETELRKKCFDLLRQARSIDGMEGSPDEYEDSAWLEARA